MKARKRRAGNIMHKQSSPHSTARRCSCRVAGLPAPVCEGPFCCKTPCGVEASCASGSGPHASDSAMRLPEPKRQPRASWLLFQAAPPAASSVRQRAPPGPVPKDILLQHTSETQPHTSPFRHGSGRLNAPVHFCYTPNFGA